MQNLELESGALSLSALICRLGPSLPASRFVFEAHSEGCLWTGRNVEAGPPDCGPAKCGGRPAADPLLAQVLDDYKIHLTGAEVSPSAQSTSTLPNAENPSNWPTQHYRVPNYRPINRDLDMSERPLGSNGGEFAFLVIMFSGVTLNATIARAWGATGGPYFPGLFKYAIGGEW